MFAGLAAVVMIDRRFRRYHVFGRFWKADWAKLKNTPRKKTTKIGGAR